GASAATHCRRCLPGELAGADQSEWRRPGAHALRGTYLPWDDSWPLAAAEIGGWCGGRSGAARARAGRPLSTRTGRLHRAAAIVGLGGRRDGGLLLARAGGRQPPHAAAGATPRRAAFA